MTRFRLPAACLFLAAGLLLVAGAAPAQQAPADAAPPDKIRKIALIETPEPDRFIALTQQSGLLWAIISMENADKLTAAMRASPGRLGPAVTDAIEAALRAHNYAVERIPSPPRERPHKFVEDYAGIRTDADVILDVVVIEAGYYRPHVLLDYGPGVRIDTRMTTTGSKQKVFDEDYGYARANRWSDTSKFDTVYKFSDMDDLRAKFAHAKEGLEKGAQPLAEELLVKVNTVNSVGGIAAAIAATKAKQVSSDPTVRLGPSADDTR